MSMDLSGKEEVRLARLVGLVSDFASALHQFRTSSEASQVTFTLKYFPYQLYPSASKSGEDKYEWYKSTKYQDSEEKMQMYTAVMKTYGENAGIDFKFGGTIANTLPAHRMIQHFQEEKGSEVADGIVKSLYSQYFEGEKHPASTDTLVTAATSAGVPESEARSFVEDENLGLIDTKMAIREQAGNGIDSVPYIMFEGKRRDFTEVGAREVEEYLKVLRSVAKESN